MYKLVDCVGKVSDKMMNSKKQIQHYTTIEIGRLYPLNICITINYTYLNL